MRNPILSFLLLITLLPVSVQPMEAVLFDGQNTAETYRLAALTLAGIVNREGARLYLANVREAWSYTGTDESWEAIYRDRGGVNFNRITSYAELVDHFRSHIRGVITYEPRRWGNFSGQSFF